MGEGAGGGAGLGRRERLCMGPGEQTGWKRGLCFAVLATSLLPPTRCLVERGDAACVQLTLLQASMSRDSPSALAPPTLQMKIKTQPAGDGDANHPGSLLTCVAWAKVPSRVGRQDGGLLSSMLAAWATKEAFAMSCSTPDSSLGRRWWRDGVVGWREGSTGAGWPECSFLFPHADVAGKATERK